MTENEFEPIAILINLLFFEYLLLVFFFIITGQKSKANYLLIYIEI